MVMKSLGISQFKAAYDYDADVMYVSDGDPRVARTEEDKDGLLWRYDPRDHHLIGLTILDFKTDWQKKHKALSKRIGARLNLDTETATMMAERMFHRANNRAD